MKQLIIPFAAALLQLNGCALPQRDNNPPKLTAQTTSTPLAGEPIRASRDPNERKVPISTTPPPHHAQPLASPIDEIIASRPKPDAVIKIGAGTGRLTPEIRTRLAAIAAQVKADEQLAIRLESYVPDLGSASLNIGYAEKTLQLVRSHLLGMGISSRHIVLSTFGSEHRDGGDRLRDWIEIYLIRPGY